MYVSSSLMALILSVIIALSGAGAVPAIPETATQTTLHDITVTIDDTAYSIAAEPYFTGAIGAELAAGTFGIQLGNEALLPMQGAIDLNGIRFSLGDTGRVYTLTNEMIAESMDCEPEDLQIIADVFGAISEMMNYDLADSLEMSRASFATLQQALTAAESTGSVNLGGESIDLAAYSGTLDAQTFAAMLDAMMNGENQSLADYLKNLLSIINRADGTQYASWSELCSNEAADDAAGITMIYETAANGDDTYDCITLHAQDEDAQTISNVTEYRMEDGDYSCAMDIMTNEGDMHLTVSGMINIADALTDAPSVDFDITCSTGYASEYPDTENPEDSFGYSSNTEITMFGDARTENGLDSLNMDLTVENSYESRSGANLENVDFTDSNYSSLNITANQTIAENEGVDTAVSLMMDAGDVSLGVSFIANQVDILFDADALFAGGETVLLTNAEDDAGMAMLEADFLALANDISTLTTQDTGLADLISAFNALAYSEDDYDYDYDDYDEDAEPIDVLDYDDYYQYLPVDEIMDLFTGAKIAIDVPEGYVVDTDSTCIAAGNNSATITYRNEAEDKYIELNLYHSDMDEDAYMVLSGDDAGSMIDSSNIARLCEYDEDNYFGASLHMDNVDVSLYFSPMPLEEVQSLLFTLHTVA